MSTDYLNMQNMMKTTSLDLDQVIDILLRNVEDEVYTMRSQLKIKDAEIQSLLEIIASNSSVKIEELNLQLRQEEIRREHEEQLAQERAVIIETLQAEVKKLKETEQILQKDLEVAREKVNVLDKVCRAYVNKSNGGTPLKDLTNRPPAGPRGKSINRSGSSNRSSPKGKQRKTEKGEPSAVDIEHLNERIVNEQQRNKNLQFLVDNQKNIIEVLREDNKTMTTDKKDLRTKIEKLSADAIELNSYKAIHDRVEKVISCCEAMNEWKFESVEVLDRLAELPYKISSYLKGHCDTISPDTTCSTETELTKAAREVRLFIEEMKGDQNFSVDLGNILSATPLSTEVTPRKSDLNQSYSLQHLNDDDDDAVVKLKVHGSDAMLRKSRNTQFDPTPNSARVARTLVDHSNSLIYHFGQMSAGGMNQSFDLNKSMTLGSNPILNYPINNSMINF